MKFEQVKKSRSSGKKRCKVFFLHLFDLQEGKRERFFGKVSSSSWLYITNNIKTENSDLTCLFFTGEDFFWNISKMRGLKDPKGAFFIFLHIGCSLLSLWPSLWCNVDSSRWEIQRQEEHDIIRLVVQQFSFEFFLTERVFSNKVLLTWLLYGRKKLF